MPELPEVETVRRGLESRIVGKRIAKVVFDWQKSFPNTVADVDEFMINAKITSVKRRAKVLMIELSSNYTLVTHLKMTGQLVYEGRGLRAEGEGQRAKGRGGEGRWGAGHPNDSLIGKLPDKTTRVTIDFDDKSKLFFNDQRKFGWMRLLPSPEVPNIDFFKTVGPEPLAADFTAKDFAGRFQRRANTTIKAALLDQKVIAGVGNIYADESLWGAKIHPANRVKDISKAKLNTLFKELRYVLELAIEKGGSTDKNYVNVEGKRGSYMDFARVFRREGQACPRCQTVIVKTRVATRGTHACPKCQRIMS